MIIDFHTHMFPPEVRDKREDFFDREQGFKLLYSNPGSKIAGFEDLIRNMDEQGIDKSVVFGFPWNTEEYFERNNDYILEAVEKYPDRLIGFCTFHPLAKGAAREFERCLESGLSGVGELAIYGSGMGEEFRERFRPIAEKARKLEVPLLLHTNEPVGHYYPGKAPMSLRAIYEFLICFPENKIVLAHWGGGIFFYGLMKKDVKEALKNTWFDTAASPYLYDREIYLVASRILGPEKILFGSDFPLIKPGRYFREMKEAELPGDAINRICGENAASLLGLAG